MKYLMTAYSNSLVFSDTIFFFIYFFLINHKQVLEMVSKCWLNSFVYRNIQEHVLMSARCWMFAWHEVRTISSGAIMKIVAVNAFLMIQFENMEIFISEEIIFRKSRRVLDILSISKLYCAF